MQATGLLQTTGASILPHDRNADQTMLDDLALNLKHRISPNVAIEPLDEKPWAGFPRHQPESLICDLDGVEHLFADDGLLTAVRQLLNHYGPLPLHARMAIAPNLTTAWAVAHFASGESIGEQEHAVPIVDDPRSALASLPLEALRLAPVTVATLRRLGVERIDALLRLPRSGLATRLGKSLVNRIGQALGEIDEPLAIYHADPEISESIGLEYPTTDGPILLDRLDRLIKRVTAKLSLASRGALCLQCRFDFASSNSDSSSSKITHPPKVFEIGLYAPSSQADHFRSLIQTRFENLTLPADVIRVTLAVSQSSTLRRIQKGLFEESCDSSKAIGGSEISRLVDTLSGRLGREQVLSVRLESDTLPENTFATSPMTGSSIQKNAPRPKIDSRRQSYAPTPIDAMRRPVTVLEHPSPLAILEFDQGVPLRFRYRGKIHRIVRHWGPERIETHWWKGPSIRRDYYRVETDSGSWWWIYRDIAATKRDEAKQWILHGLF